MGFWKKTKSAISSSLEYIEGKTQPSRYVLHPDHAYLGQKYYHKDSKLPPQTAGSLSSMGPSGPAAGSDLPATMSRTSDNTSSPMNKGQEQMARRVKPNVRISTKPISTPIRLTEDKYVVLQYRDLVNDDKIDATVDRDRDLYWVIKTAVELIVQERAKAKSAVGDSMAMDPKKLRSTVGGMGQEDVMGDKTLTNRNAGGRTPSTTLEPPPKLSGSLPYAEVGSKAMGKAETRQPAPLVKTGAKKRNPLESPSVEDFFADSRREVIDTVPTNPLLALPHSSATATSAGGGKNYTNPLDVIPWTELVIVFRRDTKEIFARKGDGRLYPVLWKKPAMPAPKRDGGSRVAGAMKSDVKFTNVEDQSDEEAWEKVDWV